MCLTIAIKLGDEDNRQMESLIEQLKDSLTVRPASKTWFRKPSPLVYISELNNGCACSMLSETADWNAPTWDMVLSVLPKLASTVGTIRKHTLHGFSFEAIWIGEEANEEVTLSIEQLVTIIRAGQLGTRTRYLVQ